MFSHIQLAANTYIFIFLFTFIVFLLLSSSLSIFHYRCHCCFRHPLLYYTLFIPLLHFLSSPSSSFSFFYCVNLNILILPKHSIQINYPKKNCSFDLMSSELEIQYSFTQNLVPRLHNSHHN